MDWMASAELLAALDRTAVALQPDRCLHSIWKFSECEACFGLCPTDAIQPGKPPTVDSEQCVHCLACLPVCPTGAITGEDAVGALSNCLARLEARRVELVCAQHPQPENGLPGADAAVKVRGCLAGLGAGGYLVLAALGLEQICPRLDGCDCCAWSSLRPQIEDQIAVARRLLEPLGLADHIEAYFGAPQETAADLDNPRPVWDANNPPLSRRDFFRMAARQGRIATARMLNRREAGDSVRQPGRDHRRIFAGLSHLAGVGPASDNTLEGLGFGNLEVAATCSACGVCANVCPTAALKLQNEDGTQFRLLFTPAACIECEVCVEVCAPAAITLNTAPDRAAICEAGEVIVQQGTLTRCEACGVLMATRPGQKLCAPCEFRRKNPLGSMMPPGFRKQIIRKGD